MRGFPQTRTVIRGILILRPKSLLTLALSSFVPQEEREFMRASLNALLLNAIVAIVKLLQLESPRYSASSALIAWRSLRSIAFCRSG